MYLRDFDYRLRTEETTLNNNFCGWDSNLRLKDVQFSEYISSSTLRVTVKARIEFYPPYTRDFVLNRFKECCEEYIDEILEEFDYDEDDFKYVEYDYSVSAIPMA